MKPFSFLQKRDIYRVYTAQTIRSTALSVISVYIPIYILNLGFSLSKTIGFFAAFHSAGLLFALFLLPHLIRRWKLISLLKFYYPVEISFLILLHFLSSASFLFWPVAVVGGLATFSYWVPMNMLLIKHSEMDKMGSDLANFFALPKVFGILGPLISAVLIPIVGFLPVFLIAIFGLILSYLPLLGIEGITPDALSDFRISKLWHKLRDNKLLIILEAFDNIIEESEWFWGIFVFIIIGTIEAPGIVGSLTALGSAAFTVLAGKYANEHAKKLVPIASVGLAVVWALRLFIYNELPAYIISFAASFMMTLFLVSYFSTIYRTVKDDKDSEEEEFMILREVSTVSARLVVFGAILLVVDNLRLFFWLPIVATVVLYILFLSRRDKLGAQT